MKPDRRDAVKKLAFIVGGTLSAPIIAGVMNGCSPDKAPDWLPSFLTPKEDELLTSIADIIIPTTDTPGAKAAMVNRYADILIKDCFTAEEQNAFKTGIAKLDQRAKDEFGNDFQELEPEEQNAFLTKIEKEAVAQKQAGDDPHIWSTIKEITLVGYFTSEIGATQALNYVPVPGGYQGCVPLEPGQKAWAT